MVTPRTTVSIKRRTHSRLERIVYKLRKRKMSISNLIDEMTEMYEARMKLESKLPK